MAFKKVVSVCFVCLGNICRSPLAEGVFRDLVSKKGLNSQIKIDSAGTSSWHLGAPPDERMEQTAKSRGILLSSRAKQFRPNGFDDFDLILAMDRANMEHLQNLSKKKDCKGKLFLFRSFDPRNEGDIEVPDPYYGGDQGFNHVYQIVARTCPKLLEYIMSRFLKA